MQYQKLGEVVCEWVQWRVSTYGYVFTQIMIRTDQLLRYPVQDQLEADEDQAAKWSNTAVFNLF
jgi:hypothetical protein